MLYIDWWFLLCCFLTLQQHSSQFRLHEVHLFDYSISFLFFFLHFPPLSLLGLKQNRQQTHHGGFSCITVPSSRGNAGKADPGLLTLAKTPHTSERVLASLEKELSWGGGGGGGDHMFVSVFGEELGCGGRGMARREVRDWGRPWTWPSEVGASDALTELITAKSSDEVALLFSD